MISDVSRNVSKHQRSMFLRGTSRLYHYSNLCLLSSCQYMALSLLKSQRHMSSAYIKTMFILQEYLPQGIYSVVVTFILPRRDILPTNIQWRCGCSEWENPAYPSIADTYFTWPSFSQNHFGGWNYFILGNAAFSPVDSSSTHEWHCLLLIFVALLIINWACQWQIFPTSRLIVFFSFLLS